MIDFNQKLTLNAALDNGRNNSSEPCNRLVKIISLIKFRLYHKKIMRPNNPNPVQNHLLPKYISTEISIYSKTFKVSPVNRGKKNLFFLQKPNFLWQTKQKTLGYGKYDILYISIDKQSLFLCSFVSYTKVVHK